MGKRANGQGTTWKRGGDPRKWQGQASVSGHRRSFYGSSQAEVLNKIRAEQAAEAAGVHRPTGRPLTVGKFLSDWLADAKGSISGTTWAEYNRILNNHVIPALGGIHLTALTHRHVNAMVTGLKKLDGGELAPRSKSHCRTVLRTALQDALREQLILINPATLSRPVAIQAQEVAPFSVADARKIAAAAERHPYGAAWLLGLMLGLRQGEVLGLLWSNVDLDAGVVDIRTNLKREDGGFVLGDLKTHQRGWRRMTLPPQIIALLRPRRPAHPAPDALVFVNEAGEPWDKSNWVRRQWRPFLRSAGVVPYRNMHTLRHTAGSLCPDLQSAQRMLGHSNIRTTADIYSHMMSETVSVGPAAVEDALFGAGTREG